MAKPTHRERWRAVFRAAPATCTIIVLCVAIWLSCAALSLSFTYTTDNWLAYHLLLAPTDVLSVVDGDWSHPVYKLFPLLGHMFVHLSFQHLFLNMVMLALFGLDIERALGSWRFVALYLASGFGGAVGAIILEPNAAVGGASGAIYGLMTLFIFLAWLRGRDLRGPIVLVAINVAASVVLPGISLGGHLGGLTVGLVAGLWLVARGRDRRWA